MQNIETNAEVYLKMFFNLKVSQGLLQMCIDAVQKTSIVWCFHSWFVTLEGSSVTPLQLCRTATAARTETAL